jgi:hypothetical protein
VRKLGFVQHRARTLSNAAQALMREASEDEPDPFG